MKFEEMNLSEEMLASLKKHRIESPTKVQEEVIPLAMQGRDIQAQSETGSGKTLAFAIPILEKAQKHKGLQSLIITPTRELAKQIATEFDKFGHGKLNVVLVYGGVSIEPQIRDVRHAEVVVGTPGRILDLMSREEINLSNVKWLVLDEADRMLDMGFIDDVEKIISQTSKERQTMLFSATLAREIIALSRRYLKNPAHIDITLKNTDYLLKQFFFAGSKDDKLSMLIHLLKKEHAAQRKLVIIFCRTKRTTDWLAMQLRKNEVNAVALNGDMSQNKREQAVRDFKAGEYDALIATDVAARGLHIDHVSHVYNYDLPNSVEAYTHRIGRTARLDKEGSAITLLADGDDPNTWDQIQRFYEDKILQLNIEAFDKIGAFRSYGSSSGSGYSRGGSRVGYSGGGGSRGGRGGYGGGRSSGGRYGGGSSRSSYSHSRPSSGYSSRPRQEGGSSYGRSERSGSGYGHAASHSSPAPREGASHSHSAGESGGGFYRSKGSYGSQSSGARSESSYGDRPRYGGGNRSSGPRRYSSSSSRPSSHSGRPYRSGSSRPRQSSDRGERRAGRY